MIPFIQQAITMGYTAAQVLNYVAKKFKTAAPGISRAKQSGYNDEDILKFLGSKINPKNSRRAEEQLSDQERYLKAVGIKTKGEKEETRNKFIGGAINLGLTGLGAYNMYQGYKGLGQTFGLGGTAQQTGTTPPTPGATVNPPPNAPQTPGQLATPASPMPGPNIGQQIGQQAAQPVANAMQPANQSQIGQAAQSPEMPQQPKQSIFDQLVGGIDIQKLDSSTQSQMKFFSLISDQLESQGKTLQDSEFKNLANKIKNTLSGKSGVLQAEIARGVTPEDIKKPPLNPLVSTPQGVGEVKGISNGKALVEIDGKTHKIDEKEIEQPPIPEKDLADLHNELIGGIEKSTGKQVSRNVNWAGYDPEAKELQYRPWSGDSYTFDDIEPEDVDMLTNLLTQRKTTGENFIGGWEEGTESPIGAAMHKLITKLKEKAKARGVKEYTKKYQTVYSAYEPAEQAAKLKKKLADQERKKREKDAKKAKK